LEASRRILRVLVFNHFNPKSPGTQTTNISYSRDTRDNFGNPRLRDSDNKSTLGTGSISNVNENKTIGGNKNDPFASRLEDISSQMAISLTIVKQEFDVIFRQGKKVTLPSTLKEDRERTSTHLYRE